MKLFSIGDHCLCALPPEAASGFVADEISKNINAGTMYIHCNK